MIQLVPLAELTCLPKIVSHYNFGRGKSCLDKLILG